METKTGMRNELKSGIFILISIIIFAGGIFFLGSERQIFASLVQYSTTFNNVQGLNRGAPVRLGGINIGRISDIKVATESNMTKVNVQLSINSEYVDIVRSDTVAMIESQGLLGDKFVNLNSAGVGGVLAPGTEIPSKEPADLTTFLKSADSLNNILMQVEKGPGLLHAIVYDEKGQKLVSDLGAAAEKISKASSDISDIATQIKTGKGTLNSLIYTDSDMGLSSMLKKLDAAAGNFKTASDAIANGTGTLGALILDPRLYENLVEVTDGAKRSFLLRQAIKSSLNK